MPRVAAGPADPVRLADQGSPAALGWGKVAGQRGRCVPRLVMSLQVSAR